MKNILKFKESLVEWKDSIMLKVLNGTINANEEPLFLRANQVIFPRS